MSPGREPSDYLRATTGPDRSDASSTPAPAPVERSADIEDLPEGTGLTLGRLSEAFSNRVARLRAALETLEARIEAETGEPMDRLPEPLDEEGIMDVIVYAAGKDITTLRFSGGRAEGNSAHDAMLARIYNALADANHLR